MISLYELPALQFVRGLIWTFLAVTPHWDDQTIYGGKLEWRLHFVSARFRVLSC